MGTRSQLQNELKSFLASQLPDSATPHVYFDPPETIKLVYPCIIYNISGYDRHFGDDIKYLRPVRYAFTVIDQNPDSQIAINMEDHFNYCTVDTSRVVNNLYHFDGTIYY